ncbi:hypothetical protein CHLNCDRAFT_18295 [Chlorella variabilis]|uniref:Uncharacterized protein n=1 Tax=Chlorella variabilis TaxID=554065 RepID=E1Z301_CHLVA|nr:hypothetical protein CHLNCDRAFT_18295 [Chlorella variabilis]EFN60083.1 hypothetical protein CHLNCDRAFT_18295 [Chlorella variabilis]|eukprot:XP_005852185.1 hypothetical protein CHLNCDRAFT_18295 [Chlorella variabilis]
MGATSHVLCKYYLHGACKFGAACAFSHSMADGESQVCKFYLRGECSYGDRCRYMHTKPDRAQPPTTWQSSCLSRGCAWAARLSTPTRRLLGGGAQQPGVWSLPEGGGGQPGWAAGGSHPSLRSLCMQWFSSGACGRGDRCQLVHGELCQHCHKHALHPTDAPARQQHLAECRLRHERLAARAASSAVECSICLEAVLSKAAPGERKFGLLTGCDHPFCLRCIRSWRQNTDGSVDIDTALRTCPVCRTTSYYIVPSLVWPTSGEEKERILAGYKAKLSLIDCRYFNFGDGTCPFGTSCFYRHAYHDGRLEDKGLRKAADEEGHIRVMQPVRLSDFIAASTAGQRLGRRR